MAEPATLSIYDLDFSVAQPYSAGHTLTDGEARALNQTRKENLGNNFRKAVKAEQDAAAAEAREVNLDGLRAAFAELDAKYEFTLATVSASKKLDPVERETRNLIKSELRTALAAEDPPRKWADLTDEQQEELIELNMDNEAIIKLAKRIVADRGKVTGLVLSGAAGTEPAQQ